MFRVNFYELDPNKSNNALHQAILDRDEARCNQLIETMSKNELNKISLGNTPLMLALKTGLINVAEKLINDERVLVNLSDRRGFSPLHFACFLREDNLINKLLDRNASYFRLPEDGLWPDKDTWGRKLLIKQTDPTALYRIDDFQFAETDRIPNWIQDNDNFTFSPLILTDLLFHVDKLCLNYGIKSADDFASADNIPVSAKQFSAYANIGLKTFLEMRKEKPINDETKQRLSQAAIPVEHEDKSLASPSI